MFAKFRRAQPIERVRSGLPLSPNEERYVLTEAVAPRPFGNPWAISIRGPLDEARLNAAILQACNRHEARRTGFELSADGQFTRYVEARARPDIQWRSAADLTPAQIRQAARDWFFTRARNLLPPTLTRFLIFRVAKDEHVFVTTFHHTTSDGVTQNAFLKEIFDAYAGALHDAEPRQYSDVWDFDWQSAPAYLEAEAFWKSRLGGVEEVGELPEDGGDPPGGEWTGPVTVRLPADATVRAKAAAVELGVSEFTFHYAAVLVLLTRLTGRRRVCSTFQSNGRRHIPDSEGVHGVFSNGLLLATEVDERESFADLAARLRIEIREALAHEVYPYHHVIRMTGLHPNFGINWFPELPTLEAPGLEISPPDMSFGRYEHDLNVRFIRDPGTGEFDLVIFFREDAFRRGRVIAVAEQYGALLRGLVRDVRAPISDTPSADVAPPGLLPNPAAPLPSGGGELIHAAFLRQAKAQPDAPAIIHGGDTYSYGELERRTRAVAARLRAAGVGPGARVAVVAERRPELVWTMLAAARLGAVFVVLDGAYPEARLATLLQISAPKAIVPAGGPEAADLALRLAHGSSIVLVDPTDAEAAEIPGLDAASPDDPAYILFTSGSTGRPKGVACSHVPLSRFTTWQAEEFGLSQADRFSMLAGLSHDPLMRDIFTPLGLGATITIPDAETVAEPGALAAWFRKASVTVTHITPAMGQVLLAGAARVRNLPALRRVFWGGDQLPPDLVGEVAAFAPGVQQANFYGSTETPQAAGVFRCEGELGRRSVPIGKGANGFQLIVVDAAKRPVGIGEAGEIAVRSNYLSLGYVDAGRVKAPGDRGVDAEGRTNIYYTGDRGFYLPNGDVLMLGRADDQVKVRGHRVELGEVTAALLQHPDVGQAITLPVGEGAALRILAFAAPAAGRSAAPAESELKAALGARLPAYMLPHRIVWLDSLPLLPNGKVDRVGLQAAAGEAPPSTAPALRPSNPAERSLVEKWSQILGSVDVTPASTFSGLGGDSLSYVQAYMATEEVIGEAPSGWQFMTIAELAARERKTRPGWSAIDTPLVIRALATTLIVAGHFKHSSYEGRATSALLLVSGFMFGGLAMKEVFAKHSAAPVMRIVLNIFIPTLILSLGIWLARSPGEAPPSYILLFTADLQDYDAMGSRQEIYLWFVHALLHMMLMIYLAVLALKALGRFDIGRQNFLLGLFVVACLGRFVLPAFMDPEFYVWGHEHKRQIDLLPTSNLATLVLGALVATAATNRERIGAAGIVAAYAALTALTYSVSQGVALVVACGLLLLIPRLPFPRFASPIVLTIAGASLWIYLTHMVIRDALKLVGPPPIALGVVVSLAAGVALWLGWTRANDLVRKLFKRPEKTADATV